jgi:hypothetical protein
VKRRSEQEWQMGCGMHSGYVRCSCECKMIFVVWQMSMYASECIQIRLTCSTDNIFHLKLQWQACRPHILEPSVWCLVAAHVHYQGTSVVTFNSIHSSDMITVIVWTAVVGINIVSRITFKVILFLSSAHTVKGNAIQLQALTGREGSRRLWLPDFKTIGTWRWQGSQPCAPAAFTFRKYSW